MKRIVVAAMAACVMPAVALAGDLKLEDVPAAVLAAAETAAEGRAIEAVSLDTEDGIEIYEFTLDGMEIDVRADGSIEEVETPVAIDDVPAPVLTALEQAKPGFVALEIERSERPDAGTFFEFDGEVGGETFDIEISADGADVKVMDD